MRKSVSHNLLLLLVVGLAALSLQAVGYAASSHSSSHGKSKAVRKAAASTSSRGAHGSASKSSSKWHEQAAGSVAPGRRGRVKTVRAAGDDSLPGGKPSSRSQHWSSYGLNHGAETRRNSRFVARPEPVVRTASRHRLTRWEMKQSWRHKQAVAEAPEASPVSSYHQARLTMPPPMRGSYESLVHQNEMAESEGLERILDDEDLATRIAQKSLVPVPVSAALQVNPDLPENRRYCRPWTARFLSDLAQAHAARFPGSPLLVTSAVRTVEYQRHLQRVNGNAAAAEGDVASPHLTGGTIDIGKSGHNHNEIAWLRSWLLPLQTTGKIDVEEEFKQSCFHISVYKSYATAPPATPHKSPGQASPSSLAVGLPVQGR